MSPELASLHYKGDGSTAPNYTDCNRRPGQGRYFAAPDLQDAVNAALLVGRPLLLTGEPGTGKSSLAADVADELGLGKVLRFDTRSDHQARDVLYTFDSLRRLYDVQIRDPRAEDPGNYVQLQALGEAFASSSASSSGRPRVVLIDEIDKAPRDFPNDLLNVLDESTFRIGETGREVRASHKPLIFITSNSERQLPDAFLRRCVFHFISFPERASLQAILSSRFGSMKLADRLLETALDRFMALRTTPGIEKPPGTAELIDWCQTLALSGVSFEAINEKVKPGDLPKLGTLIKNLHDLKLLAKSPSTR